jgi:hypothetical protein
MHNPSWSYTVLTFAPIWGTILLALLTLLWNETNSYLQNRRQSRSEPESLPGSSPGSDGLKPGSPR